MSSSSMNIKLTVVQLDLVKSSTYTCNIAREGGSELTRGFINQIDNLVTSAFNKITNRSEYDEFHSLGGDAYRISFQDVNNAYQFVQYFCQFVTEEDNNEPNRRRRIFRIGAATGTVNFDSSQSGLRRIEGDDALVSVSRLVTAAPPGYFYVHEQTFNTFDENIKQKFENESFLVPGKKHENNIKAYRCQMFINTTIQNANNNANNIVNYLFVIVKPQTNQKFYIEAQLARFINNQTKQKKDDYELLIQIQQPEDGCEKKHIIGVLDKIIQEMYKITRERDIQLSKLPIIELFLPINLLSEGFDSGEIMNEWGKKTPIGKLYPVIIRSYDRFLHNEENKARLKLAWQPQWESLEKIINDNNTEQFINIIKNNNTYVRFIDDPLPTQKKRIELFQEILSKGFPLCLWTRYKTIDNNVVKNFETIFAIDLNDTNNFCKIYRIYQNIHDIRINNMKTKSDFGYNLGILFDHDKIPTGANQLISPNMARKV
jgi:hypothetical protein